MKIKLKATQLNPEYQIAPLEYCDVDTTGLVITGNKYFVSNTNDLYDYLIEQIPEAAWDYNNTASIDAAILGLSLKEYMPTFLSEYDLNPKDTSLNPIEHSYTTSDIEEWMNILSSDTPDSMANLCAILTLITQREWKFTTINGTCQGDWQDVLFDTTMWDADSLNYLESDYFNLVSEWRVTTTVIDESGNEEIVDTICCYTYSILLEDVAKEIINIAGYDPYDDNVTITLVPYNEEEVTF